MIIKLYSPNTPHLFEYIMHSHLFEENATMIAVVKIPDFNPLPQVVVYGERLYIQFRDTNWYLEGFIYVVPLQFTGNVKLGKTLFGRVMMERYGQ